MDAGRSIDTYQSLVSAFIELLTVSLHTILAERELYPRTSFLKARKWGLAVYQSRHPGVTKWIEEAIDAVESEILKGSVKQVSLVILSPSAVPLERFVFSTASFPALPASETLTPFATVNTDGSTNNTRSSNATGDAATPDASGGGHRIPGVAMIDLVTQFRGLLSRLCSIGSKLPALPVDNGGCTFTIAIELRDERPNGEPPIGWPQPFIPSDPKLSAGSGSGSTRVTPVRNVDVGFFELEAWVEETKEKLDFASSAAAAAAAAAARSPSPQDDPDQDRITDPLLEAMEGKTFM